MSNTVFIGSENKQNFILWLSALCNLFTGRATSVEIDFIIRLKRIIGLNSNTIIPGCDILTEFETAHFYSIFVDHLSYLVENPDSNVGQI